MFGNTKGWLLSGIIFVVMAGLLFSISRPPAPTPPTGKYSEALKPIVLPADPAKIFPMTDPCDASDFYRKAIDEYKKNKKSYDEAGKTPDLKKLPALEFLAQGTNCSKLTLFTKDPKLAIGYSSIMEDLDALEALGTLAARIAANNLTPNPELARKFYQADFAMGQKMAQERVSWDEFNVGVNHMVKCSTGLVALARKANESSKIDTIRAFQASVGDYKKDKLAPIVLQLTRSADANVVGTYGGDLFDIARRSEERVWKVEAVLALGRMKFNSTSKGDQVIAGRQLKNWLNDPDPAVRYAAKRADDLTILDYRQLGN